MSAAPLTLLFFTLSSRNCLLTFSNKNFKACGKDGGKQEDTDTLPSTSFQDHWTKWWSASPHLQTFPDSDQPNGPARDASGNPLQHYYGLLCHTCLWRPWGQIWCAIAGRTRWAEWDKELFLMIKLIVLPKIMIFFLSFTQTQVVPNLYSFLSFVEQKIFWTMFVTNQLLVAIGLVYTKY